MKAMAKYPAGTARNADFVTKRAKLKPGERVINLQVDLEDLPASGLLCVSSGTVEAMVRKLDWELLNDDARDLIASMSDELDELRTYKSEMESTLEQLKKVVA